MASGFIKISRKLLDSDIMQNPVMLTVFIYLLLRANYKISEYNGVEIQRGEVVVSYPMISTACGITISQARTAIKNLILTGRITVKKHPKFSVVSVLKYNDFQNIAGNNAVKSQSNRSQVDSQIAPYKEIKNHKKEEVLSSCSNYIANSQDGDDGEEKMTFFGKHQTVLLSERQVESLLYKMTIEEFEFYLDKLDTFIFSKNAVVASHYKTILKWLKEDRDVEQ